MSWDHTRYAARCKRCGAQGFMTESSDDWNRTRTTWEGFENVPPSAEAVARKRAGPNDFRPRCGCGSSEIEVDSHPVR